MDIGASESKFKAHYHGGVDIPIVCKVCDSEHNHGHLKVQNAKRP